MEFYVFSRVFFDCNAVLSTRINPSYFLVYLVGKEEMP
jgi:hypothetical protein